MTKALTSLYDSYEDGHAAALELSAAGIADGKISLLANNLEGRNNIKAHEGNEAEAGAEAGMAFGAIIGGGVGLLAGLGLMAIPGVGPVVAAGWLATAAAGAVGAGAVAGTAGGLIGAMIGNGLLAEEANVMAEGVRRGGTLVTVLVEPAQLANAERIMRDHHMLDTKALARGYKQAGWTKFDETAPALNAAELATERANRQSKHA
jgi:hypothetical protein